MERFQIGIIGAGRIGRVHAENIAKFVPQMEIKTVADPYMSPEAEEFLKGLRIPNLSRDAEDILRDPEPPAIDYVKVSGGIFYDMMVHDFDMARFLAGSEVTEVFAYGAVLVDPAIGEAGDVDTAVVTLKFANGAMGVIDNSRRAVYGYDQRVEVFGSEGAVMDVNDTPTNAVYYGADGSIASPCYKIMWDRYTGAFAAEQQAFAEAVLNDTEPLVTGEDGLYPILIAAAATKSLKEGRPVKLSEIEAI